MFLFLYLNESQTYIIIMNINAPNGITLTCLLVGVSLNQMQNGHTVSF